MHVAGAAPGKPWRPAFFSAISVGQLRLIANCGALQLAKREMTEASDPEAPNAGPQRRGVRNAAAVLAIGAFLAFTDPFGATDDLPG